ncbi:substrate-binding periplasmic protein [Gilvimarinus sp. 1_MG-2023]|uniref:substrate-binding periplasmic protein n=1 Tax=Gilvimarinus sp. 1_MG-2023 TaxID=3062638 RepID=UPI0026E255CD|nr:transporter substrate-binding domain-containing protein [Gilvimarinus sp. 1_MG-2023]MDO6745667.1 transporter substrate-binding domain-containing protein [Gilvimarinus sp. 1_MG-2023]
MKLILGSLFAPFLALSIGSQPVHALQLQASLANEDYPPFYYYDDINRQFTGVSIEICREVVASLGHTLSFKRSPFIRLLHELREGKSDIACTLFNTSERSPGIVFTQVPHIFETISVFSRLETAVTTPRPLNSDYLKQHKVGGVRGYFYGEALQDQNDFTKRQVNTESQLVKILLAGRIDYALGNRASITHHARTLGVESQIRFFDQAVYSGPIYIGVSQTRADAQQLVADLTQAVAEFRKTDQYQTILQRYNIEVTDFY